MVERSGYWKIISVQTDESYDSIRYVSFIFDQETPRDAQPVDYVTTIGEIESRSGLDFLWELPDSIEEDIEASYFQTWALELLE